MECRTCGANNLDGAERCSACGELLDAEQSPGGESTGNPSRSTWILMGIVAVAVVVMAGVMLSAGGGGTGGGGGGVATSTVEATSSSQPTSSTVTPEQEASAQRTADALVAKDFPEYKDVKPQAKSYVYGSQPMTSVSYRTTIEVGRPDGSKVTVQRVLVVTVNHRTGEVKVAESL